VFNPKKGDRFWDQRFCRWSEAGQDGGWSLTEASVELAETLMEKNR